MLILFCITLELHRHRALHRLAAYHTIVNTTYHIIGTEFVPARCIIALHLKNYQNALSD